ncbi:recombinase family protein [Streptomyces sp. NPDC050516]|uniref:recombinase family protein n=1 Tax=Streptomyces sp. NPDC050516 TaxID=3365621 RepID=UPI0037A7E97D
MSGEAKITSGHRSRLAVVYVRQSTLLQVRDNAESTARQYGLADQAVALGWPAEKVCVIDADLGVSGRFSGLRKGFREVVSRVCLGEVGAVFGLEVSRLARSSADFARLLEFAKLTDTLLVDGDGIYDLADFNDQMLLGLKGQMSEAELHLLAGRLHGARRAAAERGELRQSLPVGYVHDLDGNTVKDPDEAVQAAVIEVFTLFDQAGSARGIVAGFAGRLFPRRVLGGVWDGRLDWGRLTCGRAMAILKNPAYAGAYAYGRNASRRAVRPDATVVTEVHRLPRDQWKVLIPDHHEGYITWANYLVNEQRLAANRTNTGARPPRQGAPLCQGIIGCGSCGLPMGTRYRRADGTPDYVCSRAWCDSAMTPGCHSIAASTVDAAVEALLLEALTPGQVHLALDAADTLQARHAHSHRAAQLAVERARFEADRSERAFHQVEPENRLVARTLEARWETKLAALIAAEQALADQIAAQSPLPDRHRLQALAQDLPALWHTSTTSAKDRKRLLRTLIADVTVRHVDKARAHIGIRWHTGATDEITCDRRANRNPTQAVDLVREWTDVFSDIEIADRLNALGLKTGKNRKYTLVSVRHIRKRHGIGVPRLAPASPGELTVPEVAQVLGIHESSVYPWIRSGEMTAHQIRNRRWCIPWNPSTEAYWRTRVSESHHLKRPNSTYETKKAV